MKHSSRLVTLVTLVLAAALLGPLPALGDHEPAPERLYASHGVQHDYHVGDPAQDSVAHDEDVTGVYSWHAWIDNQTGDTVNNAIIEIDSGHDPSLFHDLPGEAFPVSWTVDTLQAGETTPPANLHGDIPAFFTPGFDSSRDVAPVSIPDGGATQTTTVTVALQDNRYLEEGTAISVGIFFSDLVDAADVDLANASPRDPDQHWDPQIHEFDHGFVVQWGIFGPVALNTDYEFSVSYAVTNATGEAFDHKPYVDINAMIPLLGDDVPDSSSVEVAVASLAGTITFSADGTFDWVDQGGEAFSVAYAPQPDDPGDDHPPHRDPLPGNPVPPAFSRPIPTSFPDEPFVTCVQGQFQATDPGFDFGDGLASEPQYWFVKANSDGPVAIDVSAVPPHDTGHIIAQLFDEVTGNFLDEVVAAHHGVATQTLSFTASAGQLFRLEIRHEVIHDFEHPTGHHYELGFIGDVDVGVNSPALPEWLEPGSQVFHVNVDEDEALHLRYTPDPHAAHVVISSTVTVYGDPEFTDELDAAGSTGSDPYDLVFDPAPEAATLTVAIDAELHHYMLEKLSGSDTGIYFDACPPHEFDDFHPFCVPLLAGQHIDVGDVCVSDDGQHLAVTYHTFDGWELVETHLAVSADHPGSGAWTDLANRWQTNTGNAAPGRFPHSAVHDGDDHFTYVIPRSGAGTYYIGAHAVVTDDAGRTETAWGDGTQFTERGSWATWFSFEAGMLRLVVWDNVRTIPAGMPFFLLHGWVLGPCDEDGGVPPDLQALLDDPAMAFSLELDGQPVTPVELHGCAAALGLPDLDGVVKLWQYVYPAGLPAGTYTFTGTWTWVEDGALHERIETLALTVHAAE